MYLLKLDDAASLSGLGGKSFMVGGVNAVGDGVNDWLILQPDGGASAAGATKGAVLLKVEGGSKLSGLVGKSVAVGKSPVVGSGAAKWLALYPQGALVKGAAAGAAGTGVGASSKTMMLKLEGDAASTKLSALTGKTFTVGKSTGVGKGLSDWLVLNPMNAAPGTGSVLLKVESAKQLPALVGKTVTVGKSPVMAGAAGNWLVLHPASGVTAQGVAGGAAVAKGAAATKGMMASKAGMAGSAGSATAANAAGGTMWTGKGLSLGLGLGLGAWGPVILGVIGGAAVYGYVRSRKAEKVQSEEELELKEALAQG